MVTTNNPVIYLLYLFRGEPSADGFYNVLVVALAVETAVDIVIIDTRLECLVIVVDNCEMLTFVVLEDYYPVMSEYLTVISN